MSAFTVTIWQCIDGQTDANRRYLHRLSHSLNSSLHVDTVK